MPQLHQCAFQVFIAFRNIKGIAFATITPMLP
jgi:hypothetical protein